MSIHLCKPCMLNVVRQRLPANSRGGMTWLTPQPHEGLGWGLLRGLALVVEHMTTVLKTEGQHHAVEER